MFQRQLFRGTLRSAAQSRVTVREVKHHLRARQKYRVAPGTRKKLHVGIGLAAVGLETQRQALEGLHPRGWRCRPWSCRQSNLRGHEWHALRRNAPREGSEHHE